MLPPRARTKNGGTARLIADAAAVLAFAGIENARLDAEVMMAAASHNSRASIVSGSALIDDVARAGYAAMIWRRARREPLAYILGSKQFFSLDFEVTPAVLIPRPETETLVGTALRFLNSRQLGERPRASPAQVLDIGTGSGAIALAIAANAPAAEVTATDISPVALAVANRNAVRLGLATRLKFRLADGFEPQDRLGPLGGFDLIVSNPPYVRDADLDLLAPEISRYEPRAALAGGPDGMNFFRRIARDLAAHVKTTGTAIFEIGEEQAGPVGEIMLDAGATNINLRTDLAGLPRVIVANFGAD